jgi:hypothetical protein
MARGIEVFPQGSFANRTNVRFESDVDVCCLCSDTYHYNLPPYRSIQDYVGAFSAATYSYPEYRNDVENALVARFGRQSVVRGNKAFDVHNRQYDIDADVVATFEYRDYSVPGNPAYGTVLFADDGSQVTNFPKQQYDNGVAKHDQTRRRFKRQVRVQKNLRHEMEEKGHQTAKPIKSFLLESLCWNVQNYCYGHATYFEDFERVMAWLFQKTSTDAEAGGLLEENGIKRLFGAHNSWSRSEVNSYIASAWAYTH